MTNNTHAFNGKAVSNITKMEDCLAACVSDATCVAVDLDYNGPVLCWMHTRQSDLSDTESANNVYLYRLVDRCESGNAFYRSFPITVITLGRHLHLHVWATA